LNYYEMVSKNFVMWEYFINQGLEVFKKVQPIVIQNIKNHSKKLQAFREFKGRAINILSGFRTVQHNKEVGGVKGSFHLFGQAADITYEKIEETYQDDYKVLCSLFSGVIYYPDKKFFHCDIGNRIFHSITGP
jgi:zinc D-Ala-D-Ala carboxypeptidase